MTIVRNHRRATVLYDAPDYAPDTIGNWVAVDSRDYPWNTIGTALAGHGDGRTVDHLMTAREALTATGLDITILKVPVRDAETGAGIPRMFATATDEPDGTRRYFAAVSDKYEVVQPVETLTFYDEVLAQKDGAHYSATWVMREKAMMGVTIELPEAIVVDPGGADDGIDGHILGWNSFDGQTGLGGALLFTRWFCLNQMVPAIKSARRSWSLRHARNVRRRAADAASVIGISANYTKALDELANNLYRLPVNDRAFEALLQKIPAPQGDGPGPWGLDGTESDVVRRRVLERRTDALAAWRAPHNANIAGTAWGALNVIGEFAEWGRTVNGSHRNDTDPVRQRAIGTLVHSGVRRPVDQAAAILLGEVRPRRWNG